MPASAAARRGESGAQGAALPRETG